MNQVKILYLAANPNDTSRLRLDQEVREMTEKIRASDCRDSLEIISRWAVRPDDLLQSLNEHRPTIVHFSGHGSASDEIILEDAQGGSKPVSTEAIRRLFATLSDNVRLVLLNACFSQKHAEAITGIIDCAIGTAQSISDFGAIVFASSFYRAIGFGRSIQEAFDQGVTALTLENTDDTDTPKLLFRKGVDPSRIVLVGPSSTIFSRPLNITSDSMSLDQFYRPRRNKTI